MKQQSLFDETMYRDMSRLNQDDIRNENFKEVAANLKKFYSDLKILCGKEPGFKTYLIAVVEKNSKNCIQFEESYLDEQYDYMTCLRFQFIEVNGEVSEVRPNFARFGVINDYYELFKFIDWFLEKSKVRSKKYEKF